MSGPQPSQSMVQYVHSVSDSQFWDLWDLVRREKGRRVDHCQQFITVAKQKEERDREQSSSIGSPSALPTEVPNA